jgi:hypothetical protein
MVEVKQRTNKGYEIVCYYPKEHGRYTEKTGNTRIIWQTDDVAEVAAWFSRKAWGSCYGDSDYANPTVYYNGKRWPEKFEGGRG